MRKRQSALTILAACALSLPALAQEQTALNGSPWKLASQADVKETGAQISSPDYPGSKGYPAT
ncbi:MAG: hypothetical protein WCO94_03650, partial [Verrucomicrobiota bacterium]